MMNCNEKRQIEKIVRKEMKKRDKTMKVAARSFFFGAITVCTFIVMAALIYTMMAA